MAGSSTVQDVHVECAQRPVRLPGVVVQPIRTVDGDRTNITFYSDVRIDDKYRVREVNGGWAVLREALNAEHGTVERDAEGLQRSR
jgi:alkylation response protein AidB-like acyl-CoA dehydrogenase